MSFLKHRPDWTTILFSFSFVPFIAFFLVTETNLVTEEYSTEGVIVGKQYVPEKTRVAVVPFPMAAKTAERWYVGISIPEAPGTIVVQVTESDYNSALPGQNLSLLARENSITGNITLANK